MSSRKAKKTEVKSKNIYNDQKVASDVERDAEDDIIFAYGKLLRDVGGYGMQDSLIAMVYAQKRIIDFLSKCEKSGELIIIGKNKTKKLEKPASIGYVDAIVTSPDGSVEVKKRVISTKSMKSGKVTIVKKKGK